jgi:hypothetical protein
MGLLAVQNDKIVHQMDGRANFSTLNLCLLFSLHFLPFGLHFQMCSPHGLHKPDILNMLFDFDFMFFQTFLDCSKPDLDKLCNFK